MLGRVGALVIVAVVAGCHGFLDFLSGTRGEGETCSLWSIFGDCKESLTCCLTAASAPANKQHYCAKLAGCVSAQAGDPCGFHEDCAYHLYCSSDHCGCWPCGCGDYPDSNHCCPSTCTDAGACVPGEVDDPGCVASEGNPCLAWQSCGWFLTCCHTTADFDAGRLCVASEESCVQVGLGERCSLDTDCVRPLWCSRQQNRCAPCATGCDQYPLDAGDDTRPHDAGTDAMLDAADAAVEDALRDAEGD